jgi:hypothetical protein
VLFIVISLAGLKTRYATIGQAADYLISGLYKVMGYTVTQLHLFIVISLAILKTRQTPVGRFRTPGIRGHTMCLGRYHRTGVLVHHNLASYAKSPLFCDRLTF